MKAIGNAVLEQHPEKKVIYTTCEAFTNAFVATIQNKNYTEFRNKYRSVDVLLIDDIQFISNKESTQEEIFHTFNTLYEAKKQIVFASDRPPGDIEALEERLSSRFKSGLTVSISLPDYETRMAILRSKEEMEGYNIDNEVIKFIATNIKSNIRELEGALTNIVALSRLTKKEITVELTREALKDQLSPNSSREITPELIIEVVSDHYKLRPTDICSEKRNKDIVVPRQVVMYLCRDMTNAPLQQIAKYLCKKDHSTILHGCEKIAAQMEKDESLKHTIDIIRKKLNPG
jgi:chromosomal replication initiator protein